MSIFLSIASYQHSVLPFTIRQAYEKAAWPDELHVGVIDQSLAEAAYRVRRFAARERMNVLVSGDCSSLGVDGLDNKRDLNEFADECGIERLKRELHPKAYSGPWTLPDESTGL